MRTPLSLLVFAPLLACASMTGSGLPLVPAVRETAAVAASGDAADDPAIWAAPQAEQSLVIATQKHGGLYLFDLSGAIVQEIPGGRPNNVDLRDAFPWRDGPAPIVGASDRSDNTIVLWRLDAARRRLDETPRARISTGFGVVYGLCLGRSGDDFIAVATSATGDVGVWRLTLHASGAPQGERIAAFTLGGVAEGCVVDDAHGVYYLAEEQRGIWRVALNDAAGTQKRMIDFVRSGNLFGDVEGLTLWTAADGGGYLIASVQGRSRFAIYERGGEQRYLGAFRIGPSLDRAADAVSHTDGVDVVSTPLGGDFPEGLFVAQDDQNSDPAAPQNFKYVSWASIASALQLRAPRR